MGFVCVVANASNKLDLFIHPLTKIKCQKPGIIEVFVQTDDLQFVQRVSSILSIFS
jgi:hypothetical protein